MKYSANTDFESSNNKVAIKAPNTALQKWTLVWGTTIYRSRKKRNDPRKCIEESISLIADNSEPSSMPPKDTR